MEARRRLRRPLLTTLALVWLPSLPATAQSVARVRSEENLRKEPNGDVLARVLPGASFEVVDRRDPWLRIEVVGWVWARSLQVSEDPAFDLVVSEPQGENLRADPSGTILARLARGMLLDELERRPGWIRVRRPVWIWSPSVTETSSPAVLSWPAADSAAPVAPAGAGGFVQADARGAAILLAPDGDTLARTVPGAELAVLARQGNWARVRLEGWTWLPTADPGGAPAETDPPSGPVTPARLAADPAAFRGRVVTWEVQFISLERAEKVRTDFYEGEPFLLTRYGGPDGSFVYVAVPPERTGEVGGLIPLERLRVTGRIRAGASALTGSPIIDMLELERVRGAR
ncbi:MAG TPA: hypothetical protein VK849_09200 [Longimicrobiales bacterium]|nr:hypothetical protein [Longimicrobiales bacterium]